MAKKYRITSTLEIPKHNIKEEIKFESDELLEIRGQANRIGVMLIQKILHAEGEIDARRRNKKS